MGHFIWSGQDYLGEPTPYHTKNSYFGMIDTAGFEKDGFYVFQSGWAKKPMVHLLPYWDWNPGQTVDVRAISSLKDVELFLSGRSLGRAPKVDGPTHSWQFQYQPGTVKAVGYDGNGNIAAQDERESFGEAEQLKLEYEHYNELTFVSISALDARGKAVWNANRRIRVKPNGGELVGMDNGDAADYQPYREDNRRMFNGKLLAVIRHAPGEKPEVEASFDETDIPIRKVELTLDGLRVRAKILPENAAYADLQWRLTNAAGVDSNLGTLEVDADGCGSTLRPTGNGEAFIRCGVTNGMPHIALYSQVSLTLSGYREATLDPFTFTSAGLYTSSDAELGNGNDRGVATPRGEASRVTFAGLDFAGASSDEMSVWLFPLIHEPFTFEVWEGLPGEGTLLAQPLYDHGMIWNQYREVRFKLAKALYGTATVSFVFRLKTHFKGFVFHGGDKAFSPMNAASADQVYGDSFVRKGGEVQGIRNNTTLIFENLDLASEGAGQIALIWRSRNAANPLQLIIETEMCQTRDMLTLPAAQEYTEQAFPLTAKAVGRARVSLVFLPGAALDLRSVRFLR